MGSIKPIIYSLEPSISRAREVQAFRRSGHKASRMASQSSIVDTAGGFQGAGAGGGLGLNAPGAGLSPIQSIMIPI